MKLAGSIASYVIVAAVSAAAAYLLATRPSGETATRYVCKTVVDTVTVVRVDTVVPPARVVRERVVDTVYYAVGEAVLPLPVTQRTYGDSTYRAWVSGIDPTLDSIRVYPRVVTRTVTRERTIEAVAAKNGLYADFGVYSVAGRLAPVAGIRLDLKKGVAVGADVGYCDGLMFGLRVGARLN